MLENLLKSLGPVLRPLTSPRKGKGRERKHDLQVKEKSIWT